VALHPLGRQRSDHLVSEILVEVQERAGDCAPRLAAFCVVLLWAETAEKVVAVLTLFRPL
jgi:hypothetical protein